MGQLKIDKHSLVLIAIIAIITFSAIPITIYSYSVTPQRIVEKDCVIVLNSNNTGVIESYSTSKLYYDRSPCDINTIVIHTTGNKKPTATALFHAEYLNRQRRQSSWHYSVDDLHIIKSFPHRKACWHSGNVDINWESIGIELCQYKGMDLNKAIKNLDIIVKDLLYEYPHCKIITHHDASGKHCPDKAIISDETWKNLCFGWDSYKLKIDK